MVAAMNEIVHKLPQTVSEKKQEIDNSSCFFTIVVDHQEWETQKDSRRVDNKFSFTDDGLCCPEHSAGRDHPAAGNSNLDTHKRGQDWERSGI